MIASLDRLLEAQLQLHKNRVLRPLERQLGHQLATAWRAQGRRFLVRLESLRAQFPVESAESLRAFREAFGDGWEGEFDAAAAGGADQFTAALTAALQRAVTTGAISTYAGFGDDTTLTLDSPIVTGYLAGVADLVTGLDATTKDRLRTLISSAVDSGTGYDRLASMIGNLFDDFGKQRAQLVAVTELARAYENGAIGAARDMTTPDQQLEKSWVDVEDSTECEDCQANAEAGWIALDDTFPSGDDTPPQHPGCRCATVFAPAGQDQAEAS